MTIFDTAADVRRYLAECGVKVPRATAVEGAAGNWFVAIPDTASCAVVDAAQDALAGTNAHLGLAPL